MEENPYQAPRASAQRPAAPAESSPPATLGSWARAGFVLGVTSGPFVWLIVAVRIGQQPFPAVAVDVVRSPLGAVIVLALSSVACGLLALVLGWIFGKGRVDQTTAN